MPGVILFCNATAAQGIVHEVQFMCKLYRLPLANVVFTFPGVATTHNSHISKLDSPVLGTGELVEAAETLRQLGLRTLSLPTVLTPDEKKRQVAVQALAALSCVLGAGYYLIIPIRAYSASSFIPLIAARGILSKNVELAFDTEDPELLPLYTSALDELTFLTSRHTRLRSRIFPTYLHRVCHIAYLYGESTTHLRRNVNAIISLPVTLLNSGSLDELYHIYDFNRKEMIKVHAFLGTIYPVSCRATAPQSSTLSGERLTPVASQIEPSVLLANGSDQQRGRLRFYDLTDTRPGTRLPIASDIVVRSPSWLRQYPQSYTKLGPQLANIAVHKENGHKNREFIQGARRLFSHYEKSNGFFRFLSCQGQYEDQELARWIIYQIDADEIKTANQLIQVLSIATKGEHIHPLGSFSKRKTFLQQMYMEFFGDRAPQYTSYLNADFVHQ